MNVLGPLARPAFSWNDDVAMRQGGKGRRPSWARRYSSTIDASTAPRSLRDELRADSHPLVMTWTLHRGGELTRLRPPRQQVPVHRDPPALAHRVNPFAGGMVTTPATTSLLRAGPRYRIHYGTARALTSAWAEGLVPEVVASTTAFASARPLEPARASAPRARRPAPPRALPMSTTCSPAGPTSPTDVPAGRVRRSVQPLRPAEVPAGSGLSRPHALRMVGPSTRQIGGSMPKYLITGS